MFYYRPSAERGQTNVGWIHSQHSFSFGDYKDPKHLGFSALRVLNEDLVKPGAGFDTHAHRDMEIITYVISGAIEHRDSLGNEFVINEGEIQLMSAGKGIQHSEFNHSDSKELHFLQIWIQPKHFATEPGYQQRSISSTGKLTPLVTDDGRGESLVMIQDASMFRVKLIAGDQINFNTHYRPGYLHVIAGKVHLENYSLEAGDGIGVYQEEVQLSADSDGLDAIWIELPSPVPL